MRIEELTAGDRGHAWIDRFGWPIWWHGGDVQWWVTQAPSGAGSDRPRTVDDLYSRGPFTQAGPPQPSGDTRP